MFEENVRKIRESVYGKDVREAIADGLEKAYTDSNTSVEMEVIAARGAFDSLGDRLDAADAEIKNNRDEFTTLVLEMEELEQKIITPTENFMMTKKALSLSEDVRGGGYNTETHIMNEGTGVTFPIFELVEDSDSLLAVIYYIKFNQNGADGFVSCPAFIRESATTGYYATKLEAAYTGTSYYNRVIGAQLNFSKNIDTQERFSFSNDHSGKTMKLSEVTAFILTR